MKGFLSIAAALSLAVSDVSAHYIFQQLSIGGTKYPVYQHIRKNANYNSPVECMFFSSLFPSSSLFPRGV
jgi:hypothetical protein